MQNLKERIYSKVRFSLVSINKISGILSIFAIVSFLLLNEKLNKFPSKVYSAKDLPVRVYSNDSNGRLMGIGEFINGEWIEYITFKKKSRLNNKAGESAITVHNINNKNKTFELGFYKYGSTWATDHELVEFWIGHEKKGAKYSSFSVKPMYAGFGSRIEVRNGTDTKAITIDNWESLKEFRKVVHEPISGGNDN
tara:strand:- start:4 stop:588 length:585 start_codon:yes stop_codon:yes gene_type:complete